ncbi:hypothetical protein MUP77_09970 [Candidatus Bathyarchaeota archaeon]|nr:hypothetical protein [Candidatus Bathyarchaeota archaeon]
MANEETKEICKQHGMTDKEADEFIAGCKRGIEARHKGDVIPWNEVKKELGLDGTLEIE